MKILLTLLAVALLVVLSPVAHAEFIQINYAIGISAQVPCVALLPGPVMCTNVPGPPLDITGLNADSNSPGTATFAEMTSADVDLVNTSASDVTIDIVISANHFTTPGDKVPFFSNISGTVLKGGPDNLLLFQSCFDPLDRLVDTSLKNGACPSGSFGSGMVSPNITSPGTFQSPAIGTTPMLGPSYALDQSLTIILFPGAEITWTASTAVAAPAIPEPTSSILVLGGTGLLAFGALARKRLFRK
jgi:hypothetical protein